MLTLKSADIGRVRVSVTPLGESIPGWDAASDEFRSAIESPLHQWSDRQREMVVAAYYRATTPPDEVSATCRQYREAMIDCRAGWAHTLIAQTVPMDRAIKSRVLPRGNWQDESGELVTPQVPAFLPQPDSINDRRLTRLDLADWLTSPENPLVARHFVNRTWSLFFGNGLSANLDDLGNQGEWPSHPALLDWLSYQFRDTGWDVKRLVRTIVTSETYKQRAAYRPELLEIDPYNRLLAQQSPRDWMPNSSATMRWRSRDCCGRISSVDRAFSLTNQKTITRICSSPIVVIGRTSTADNIAVVSTCIGNARFCIRCWPILTHRAGKNVLRIVPNRTAPNKPLPS